MDLNDYKESLDKQEKGSPCYLGEGSFDVKRIHTPEYNKQVEEIKLELYGFSAKEMDDNLILAHWLCEYGVTGWSGVFDGEEELKYSQSNARKVFLNPEMFMSVNSLLVNHARDYANYLHDEVEKDIDAVKKN